MQLKYLILFKMFLLCMATQAQYRGMYVDKFDEILGISTKEDSLLAFSKEHNIKKLNLYDVHKIAKTTNIFEENNPLTVFIKKARHEFQIQRIGVSGENVDFFKNVVLKYNENRQNLDEKFDFYTIELEFWRDNIKDYCDEYLKNTPCTNENLFKNYLGQVKQTRDLIRNTTTPIDLEAYVGRPSDTQIAEMAVYLDRILIHAYRKNPDEAFSDSIKRLKRFTSSTPNLKKSIIFSGEPDFMKNYLQKKGFDKSEKVFLNHLSNLSHTPDDFMYFAYTFLERQ